MVDYIKLLIKDLDPCILENNFLLSFYDNINLTTGELKTVNKHGNRITPRKTAQYKGLEFKIYETGTITLNGSLHKYWNSGAHNYNDFNFQSFVEVVNDLKDKFRIKSEQCILKGLEIGINITPPIPTNEIIDNCLLHQTTLFTIPIYSDEGKYKQAEHKQYIIKIYNKALHYTAKGFEIKGEIMRFEIKFTRMEKLHKKGFFTLQDLINYGLSNFKDVLLTEWQNVFFYDNTTQIDTLSKKLKDNILNYRNPNYWSGLIEKKQRENFKYHRKQLKEITQQHSVKVQNQIAEIIAKKFDELNTYTTQIDTLTILSNRVVLPDESYTLKRVCKVTGLSIEMQKEKSHLLSHTGLIYYYQTNRKIYLGLKRKYLSEKWEKSDFKTQVKELAHNIRNADSNQRIKQNRMYKSEQLNLLELFTAV